LKRRTRRLERFTFSFDVLRRPALSDGEPDVLGGSNGAWIDLDEKIDRARGTTESGADRELHDARVIGADPGIAQLLLGFF